MAEQERKPQWPPGHVPGQPRDTPALPCPECRSKGKGGGARIGNQRNSCRTCNNWAQNVMRLTRKRLMTTFAKEYKAIQLQVEADLYPQVIEDWNRKKGLPR